MKTTTELAAETVVDESSLDRLAPEWTALNAKCGPSGFFTRFEVVKENWTRYRDDPRTSLHVIAIREHGKLVFAAPMFKRHDLLLTHTLQWLDSRTPLYDDVLLDSDSDIASVARIFSDVLRSSWTSRVLKIGFVLEGSDLHRVLDAAGMPFEFRTVAPSLDISRFESWDDYLTQQSANRRQQYRLFSRRLQKAGSGSVELVTGQNERRNEISALFAQKRSWVSERDDLLDWIVPEETEKWFQHIVKMDDARNKTHLLRFASDTEWIGSLLLLERDGTIFLSKIAHNPAWSRYSPGWLLILEAVRFSIGRKATAMDFMIGHGAWKERLSDRSRSVFKSRVGLRPW